IILDNDIIWSMSFAPFDFRCICFYSLPTVGSVVWIEFEHGDPYYPIWSGCWWCSVAEMPPTLLVPPPPYNKVLIQTDGGNSILLDDTPGLGGITLQTSGGQKIKMTALGIEIDNGMGGSIQLRGRQVWSDVSAL